MTLFLLLTFVRSDDEHPIEQSSFRSKLNDDVSILSEGIHWDLHRGVIVSDNNCSLLVGVNSMHLRGDLASPLLVATATVMVVITILLPLLLALTTCSCRGVGARLGIYYKSHAQRSADSFFIASFLSVMKISR